MQLDFCNENNLEKNDIYEFLKINNISIYTKFIVDRFEENFAICENKENGNYLDIPKSFISKDVKQGNIIKFENGLYIPDKETYAKEVEEIKNLANSVFKRKN